MWAELAGHLLSRVPEKAVDRDVLTPPQKLPKREWEKLWAAGCDAGCLAVQKPGAGGVWGANTPEPGSRTFLLHCLLRPLLI